MKKKIIYFSEEGERWIITVQLSFVKNQLLTA
jgi:hypothetical protein